jgi:hypothetical protein
VCSRTWKRGSAEDYARIFGGSGRTGTTASTNCAVAAYRSSMQRSLPVRQRGSGACQDTRRSNKHCPTATSTRSASPDSMSLSKLNPVEPPWYVTRMPGGVGVAPCKRMEFSRLRWRPRQSLTSSRVPSLAWCPATATAKRRQGGGRPERK